MDLHQYASQATTRGTAVPVPKAGGHGCGRRGHIRQDVARQQREFWQAVATLTTKNKRALRAEHLFGRQRDLRNRPAVAIQTP
jgi:hypothetical protein